MTGTVQSINVERGFGFIKADCGDQVFFHCKELLDGVPFDELLLRKRLEFDIQATDKPLPRAVRVRLAT